MSTVEVVTVVGMKKLIVTALVVIATMNEKVVVLSEEVATGEMELVAVSDVPVADATRTISKIVR